jgi:molybdopterin-guanine dinucleotide biosynthesis protein A
VPVVADGMAGAGVLGGLYTALVEAPTEQVLVIACDMPFLTAPFLSHLASLGAESGRDRQLLLNVNTPEDCQRASILE